MKNIFFVCFASFLCCIFSCNTIWNKTIQGNGKIASEQRNISDASSIKSYGSFDIEITPGTSASVKVEADENLFPYIVTQNEDGSLIVRTKDKVNLSSADKIKVYIVTDKIENIQLTGSGNINGNGFFQGGDHLKLSIEGTGNINLDVNTPSISSSIAGTGNIILSGETKDSKVSIAGVGDYDAENLRAENADIHVAGSGNAKVFASSTLNVDIAGSGDIYYSGTPTITKSIAGSGKLKQMQ